MNRDWLAFWSRQNDPRYGTDEASFVQNHGREISILLGEPAGKRVLELGCGSGTLYQALGFDRSETYRGVDFSQKMLDAFHMRHSGVQTLCADASRYEDSFQYDIVFSNQVAQYFDRHMLQQHIANARAMLAPGGRLFLCSIPWKAARSTYFIQPADDYKRRVRGLCLLGLSLLGIDRLGHWYSFREIMRIARNNALTARFYGCMHYSYRFHAVLDADSNS